MRLSTLVAEPSHHDQFVCMHRLLLRLSQRIVCSGITHTSGRLELHPVATSCAATPTKLCRGASTVTGRACADHKHHACASTLQLPTLLCLAAADTLRIQGETPIQQAIQACCSSLGRQPGPAEATLVSIGALLHVCHTQVQHVWIGRSTIIACAAG